MRDALRAYGQASELARADSSRVSEACFERPVAADLMQGPRKIAGAAQRRNRRGLLQQGSAQIGNLPDQFVVDFAQYLCPETQPEEVPAQLIARAEEIATERYASSDWLHRR
jgi:lipoate-protein ligase A